MIAGTECLTKDKSEEDSDGCKPADDDKDDASVEIPLDTPGTIDDALASLREYQRICGIPQLPEKEERAILEWIVNGGHLPENLKLDERWSNPRESEALLLYNTAQIYLLIAMAKVRGRSPKLSDVQKIGDAFALAAVDQIRMGSPDQVIVHVIDRVTLLIDVDPPLKH